KIYWHESQVGRVIDAKLSQPFLLPLLASGVVDFKNFDGTGQVWSAPREGIEACSEDHESGYATRNCPAQCLLCVSAAHEHTVSDGPEKLLSVVGSNPGGDFREHGTQNLAEGCFVIRAARAKSSRKILGFASNIRCAARILAAPMAVKLNFIVFAPLN